MPRHRWTPEEAAAAGRLGRARREEERSLREAARRGEAEADAELRSEEYVYSSAPPPPHTLGKHRANCYLPETITTPPPKRYP